MLHLFFHSPCFDGIVSAVVAWDYFEHREGAADVRLHPVNYDLRPTWRSKRLPRSSVVVDFLFHPAAQFWADHHATTFADASDGALLDARPAGSYVYAPDASSCAVALRDYLQRQFGYRNPRFDALVEWADRVDSARYRSPREALLAPAAALQISLTLAEADTAYCCFLVAQLKAKSISAVARDPKVQRRVRDAKGRLRAGLRDFRKAAALTDDDIVVFDVDTSKRPVSRYAPYYYFPEARYSVGVMRSPEGAKVTAMRNPWREFRSVPIGSLAAKFGGGGHQRVGSILLRGRESRRATEVLNHFVEAIREHERSERGTSGP